MRIAVFCEGRTDHAAALIAKARAIAPGAEILALAEEYSSDILYRGADRVLVMGVTEDDCAQGDRIAWALKSLETDAVLFPATVRGRFLSAWAAAKMGTGLTADCTDLGITPEGLLLQRRPAFGSNVTADILTPNARPQMASVRPGVFAPEGAEGPVKKLPFSRLNPPEAAVRLHLKEHQRAEGGIPLQSARVVIAGGKGIGSREGFEVLRRLATLLGGAVGATRSAVDAGWISYEHQIGQTGVIIRPALYMAFGISGMAQHVCGITSSRVVVAVNTDRNAPIFSSADYGIVAPWRETAEYIISYLERKGRK